MEVFGADLMEHNIGGYFDHKTHQIFDSRHNLIGVITKDMEKEQVDNLYKKYLVSEQQEIYEGIDSFINSPMSPEHRPVSRPKTESPTLASSRIDSGIMLSPDGTPPNSNTRRFSSPARTPRGTSAASSTRASVGSPEGEVGNEVYQNPTVIERGDNIEIEFEGEAIEMTSSRRE
ncbi:uncharacterized protein LOC142345278 [Convolutriloba macropyga]|uniref:uncharacterized protein LOC142345277 n=1 Tax=Convolutriloba macropyga TaxID=536237 RepID=UPI003F51DB2E